MPLDIATGVPHSIENTTGLFHMSILDENAGSASFAYLSSYDNSPEVNLGSDITTDAATVTLSGPSGYADYLWSNGSTTSAIVVDTSGDYSLTVTDEQGCQAMDFIHITFDQATYIPETNQAPITLYPNPSHGKVFIDFNTGISIQNIQVFNSKGELTPVQLTMKADQATLTGLQPGLHFVIVQTEAGHFQSKVIVK